MATGNDRAIVEELVAAVDLLREAVGRIAPIEVDGLRRVGHRKATRKAPQATPRQRNPHRIGTREKRVRHGGNRQQRIAAGLCGRCGRPRLRGSSKTQCLRCKRVVRAQQAMYQRARRARLKEAPQAPPVL